MISLLHLNKLIKFTIFFTLLISNSVLAATAIDIWENKQKQNEQTNEKKDTIIKTPILLENTNKISVQIDEEKIDDSDKTIIGIFDPIENNFNTNMWSQSDGQDITNILERINKLNLSKFSQDLLFRILFTSAYPPRINLTSKEFLKIKINWLIENQRLQDLETLLKKNPEVGHESGVIRILMDEYLSKGNISSACDDINFIIKDVQNDYLDKFTIYCLINNDRKEEAQLVLDLLKERGFKDKFFENKINFLLGFTDKTNQEILDNNLLNFYLSHITSDNFEYEPTERTDRYIWRYLSSANLIKTDNITNEEIILTYEKAAADDSFDYDEVFEIYQKINFSFDQLLHASEVYKTLPNYKARALIYQSLLLNDNIEKKLNFAFLLKDLFLKDGLSKVYDEELGNILANIDLDKIPRNYEELVETNLNEDLITERQIRFNNDILHRSKIIKHFLDSSEKTSRTEKDFKTIYKKIKKNKKYYYSVKDFAVLESLRIDGVSGVPLPEDIKNSNFSSLGLKMPESLENLLNQNQTGLIMLNIIEIIGNNKIQDLDPETIYYLNKILNEMNLIEIRNKILSESLPVRV
jgi:hypothetical protein